MRHAKDTERQRKAKLKRTQETVHRRECVEKMSGRRIRPSNVKIELAEDFRVVLATGAYGTLNSQEGQITFYTHRLEPKTSEDEPEEIHMKEPVQELQIELHLPSIAFKNIAKWMTEYVERVEKELGRPIEPVPKKPKSAGQQLYSEI